MRAIHRILVACLLVPAAWSSACGAGPFEPPDGDGDVDVDVDCDIDGDIDADADADLDAEEATWPVDPPPNPQTDYVNGSRAGPSAPALCLDGTVQDEPGFADCEDAPCLAAGRCCVATGAPWTPDLAACPDGDGCGLAALGSGRVLYEPPAIVLDGSCVGEVGVLADEVIGLSSSPRVSFVAALARAGVGEAGGCEGEAGVALVDGLAPLPPGGLEPLVGLVLDGQSATVRLIVLGRTVAVLPVEPDLLRERRGYGFALSPERGISVWSGLEIEDGWEEELETRAPAWTSEPPPALAGRSARLAVFGRVGARGASVEGPTLVHDLCEEPARHLHREGPVLTAAGIEGERAGRPSVVAIPQGFDAPLGDDSPALLMVFETRWGLGAATSWDGRDWRFVGRVMVGQPPTEYGRYARRAPSVVVYAAPGEPARYHLWYEGISERDDGESAVLHAESANGLDWVEHEQLAIEPDPSRPWRRWVGGPSVAVQEDGSLIMVFVGRDPATGRTSLGRASSQDGKEWLVEDEPLAFEPAEADRFERDGVGQPALVRRGDRLHLWYVGWSGSRRSIGYAVSSDGEGRLFHRVGRVLAAARPWEGPGLGGPSVVLLASEVQPDQPVLHLWYEAGPQGAEAIGLATRLVPTP